MRILHSIPSVNLESGGPIQGVLARVPLLREMGHDVEIVSLDRGDEPYVADCPVKVHPMSGHATYGYTPKLVPWLEEHYREYDHIVVNGIWQYNGIGVEEALRGTDKPYFVFTHGMLDPWFRRTYPLKHLKKQAFWLLKQYRVLHRARSVLFTCEEERLLARNAFFPYRIRETVVNYGTARPDKSRDEYLAAFRAAHPQLDGRRFVLYLSRIHVKKGVDLLVRAYEAMARDATFDLAIAGPDPTGLGSKLAEECRRSGTDSRVHWLGMVKGDAKYGAFHAAEASILPSHQENFGITVAESLACGTPTLISNKVNIWREIVEDGAGIVADDTLEGTRKLLLDWAATPAEKRSEMSANAARCYDERFEIGKSVASFLEALDAPPK